ncbi:MAG: substrate-binding domain-containing protein [Lentisphaeria bacterium]|nr:substrate-binding domain-containing protein [Lentisphaeria bacterium]
MIETGKPQYLAAAEVLAGRIKYGDYLISAIPSTRKLAAELKISHIVARKAVEKLIDDGLCRRLENGRIIAAQRLAGSLPRRQPTVAMLFPAFSSNYFQRSRFQIEKAARRANALFRPVNFVHWSDPVIAETLRNFDGVFLFGCSEALEPAMEREFENATARIVTVDFDLTALNIPRIALFDASSVRPLLNHLARQGARRIACLNTQPCDVETTRRINIWLEYAARLGAPGTLYNDPVRSYEDPAAHAYAVMQKLIPTLDCDALFCTNETAAYGAGRALLDAGLRPGDAVKLCTVGDGGAARFFSPSITCIEMPDAGALFDRALAWMSDREQCWGNDLNAIPRDIPLFIGESTSK